MARRTALGLAAESVVEFCAAGFWGARFLADGFWAEDATLAGERDLDLVSLSYCLSFSMARMTAFGFAMDSRPGCWAADVALLGERDRGLDRVGDRDLVLSMAALACNLSLMSEVLVGGATPATGRLRPLRGVRVGEGCVAADDTAGS